MLLALAVAVVATPAFACTPTHVWAADGPIWCAEGDHFRLHGIVARQPDGRCLSRRRCPAMDGAAARSVLVALLHPRRSEVTSSGHVRLLDAPPLRCVQRGTVGGTRTASCSAVAARDLVFPTGRDLACALIFERAATEWRRYSKGMLRTCTKWAPAQG